MSWVGRPRGYVGHKEIQKERYGKVKGFRLQPTAERLLTDCFHMLSVEGENFNQKMRNFIPVAHKAIKRLVDLEEENKQLKEM